MVIRLLLVVACSTVGYFIALKYYTFPLSLLGLAAGLFLSILVIKTEQAIRKLSLRIIFGGVIGTVIGLLIALLFTFGLRFIPGLEGHEIIPLGYIYVFIPFILGYLGLVLGSKKSEDFRFPRFSGSKGENREYRILDTSAIIDGRMADICDTGFIDGTLIVPRFVLDELQLIADSSDHMKRSRGRRGLDILNRMQKNDGVKIEIADIDFPKIKGVDSKLVALAKERGGKIVTNDYNLNKVAELQGIKILNINDLANALKPLVLPGEAINVRVIKEGKEAGQGLAYLDDGTMVVVENGIRHVGKSIDVVVTSVLQTSAGRMVFSALKNEEKDSASA